MKKRIYTLMLALVILFTPSFSLGHGGRTDSNGGHKDNKNKSGLGSYHYHCNGHGAHLHPGGVCPYNKKAATTKSISKVSASKSTTSKASKVKTSTAKIEENKKIQKKLNDLGYDCGTVDGSLGAKSIKAIKKFQKDMGLDVDGLAGKKTKMALGF